MRIYRKRLLWIMMSLSLIILMAVPGLVSTAAGNVELEKGKSYHVNLDFFDWEQQKRVVDGMSLSDNAVLKVDEEGNIRLNFLVESNSCYDAIYLVKQSENNAISTLDVGDGFKIGTDWSSESGGDLYGYSDTMKNYQDEKVNGCFQLLHPLRTDQTKDRAEYSVQIDPNEKIGLIGYRKEFSFSNTTDKNRCNSITMRIDLGDVVEITDIVSGVEQGTFSIADGLLDRISFSQTHSTSYAGWDNNDLYMCAGTYPEDITVKSENTSEYVNVTLTFSDDYNDQDIDIEDILSCEDQSGSAKKIQQLSKFKAYERGNEYRKFSDNLYHDKQVELRFDYMDLLYGKRVTVNGFYTRLFLSKFGYATYRSTNAVSGIFYENNKRYIQYTVDLAVKVNHNESVVNNVQELAGDGKYYTYYLDIQRDDVSIKETYDSLSKHRGAIFIPVPEGWSEDELAAQLLSENGDVRDEWAKTKPSSSMKLVTIGGKRYFQYSNLESAVVCGGYINLYQSKVPKEIPTEAGIYKVEVGMVRAGLTVPSMANGCLEKTAYLEIDEQGTKRVYLSFHGLPMQGGLYAYLGALWNKTDADVTYYDYETDEDGSLLENAEFDPILEFPCVKSAMLTLSDDTYDTETHKYAINVVPPAMGAGQPYNVIYGDPIGADLAFYNIEKIEDASSVKIPAYQKAVLRRILDKADRYDENSYSADSWQVLQTAVSDGKAYYDSLKDTDAYADAEISEAIKNKTDAVEHAIQNLKATDELVESRNALNTAIEQAKTIKQGEKTDSAFALLQSSIQQAEAVEKDDMSSVGDLQTAQTDLENAITAFDQSEDASMLDPAKLEDGTYFVYAEMKKIDKKSDSMSNAAIDHTVKLVVENGTYTLYVDFKGLKIGTQLGYLQNLLYYDTGYTYDSFGEPQGALKTTTVITTQKNEDGSDVTDSYNEDGSFLYPDLISLPLVDKGTQEYIPLQVFVPVMEAIQEGSGTQNVLMKIDWSSLSEPKADYTKVDEALGKIPSDLSIYTDESAAKVTLAQNAVIRDKLAREQELVDAYAEAIENAVRDLTEKTADYTRVDELLAKIPEDLTIYTNESAERVNAAKNAVVRGKKISEQEAVNKMASDLETAIKALVLTNGEYTVYAEMKKVDRKSDSMSNAAIDHTLKLKVENGEYIVTVDFKGISFMNSFGYLKNLYYYDAGYTYDDHGEPQGTVKEATVLSTQKNEDGTDVTDSYNEDGSFFYPDLISFPLVDKGTEEYVPLQVFVPIMEAIQTGSGTQNVLMKIDWSSVKEEEKEADYTNVDAALEKIPEDLSIYTEESVADVNSARKAVVRDKKISEQGAVDKMASDISEAVKALVKKPSLPTTEPATDSTTKPTTQPATEQDKSTQQPTTTAPDSTADTQTGSGQKTETPTLQSGQETTVANATYKVTKTGSSPAVEYTGSTKKKASVTIPDTVTVEGVNCKVTSIAKGAFKNNTKVTSVTIGKNVTKIGSNAFKGAKKLKKITVKSKKLNTVGKNAFKGVAKKATVKLPKGLTKKQKNTLKKKLTNAGLPKAARIQ